jgi:integrase
MASIKFTKGIIENTPLPETGQAFLWDTEVRGFGVRFTPTARSYIVQARVKGRERRVTLGRHGALTLKQARNRALRELSKMSEGVDPVMTKKREQAHAVTLSEVVSAYLKDRRNLKPSSRADIQKHLDKSFSDWAEKPIAAITRDMVLKRFRELTDRGPAQANQAFRNLRALVNYAIGAYRTDGVPTIPENPVKAISDLKIWNYVKPRSGRIPTDKVGVAWNLLQELRTSPDRTTVSRTLADAVTFLLLTGCRWGEMAALQWKQVNLEDGSWFIADPKNRKAVTFPLSDVALDILKERPRKGDHVFPARTGEGHITDARHVLMEVSGAVGVPITAHDLRRTFRSIAGEVGVDFWKTKLLMGHKISGDVTIQHYTETNDLRYLKKDIQAVADWIVRQGAIAAAGNVVQIPVRTKGGR